MAKVTIELDDTTAAYLRVLSDDGTAEETLSRLALHAADGVRRPGAWERGWVCQAFGDDWNDRVTQDPSVPHFVVPKDIA
ncbi:hypothetical protein [Sorangium sp. So ce693]|uniref:hypothetical protein n=1 Tax=Sorangium sp. So ce693 TaxID=3133318 RepID=UPI003F630F82